MVNQVDKPDSDSIGSQDSHEKLEVNPPVHQSQASQWLSASPLHPLHLLSPEPVTPNKRCHLKNAHEGLEPDHGGIISDDDSSTIFGISPENDRWIPSLLGEGGIPSMGREDSEPEGITWVNKDVEDVVQGGHQDKYDVCTISIICT